MFLECNTTFRKRPQTSGFSEHSERFENKIQINIMLITLILTPSFSSPLLEENAVGVRIQSHTE